MAVKRLHDKNILRIIDANLNRATEGLRVCEEIVRFVLNDKYSTGLLKEIRHRIQKIIASSKVRRLMLYESRDVKSDVGIDFFGLEKKHDWQSVFFANMQRVKESLRVLEEFFKLFDERTGERFKGLRFEAYGLEKKIITKSKALSNNKYYLRTKAISP